MANTDDRRELDTAHEQSASPALLISNAVGHLHKQFAGRGPTAVRTHIDGDFVACVLAGGLTRVEETVREHAGDRPVVEIRLRLQAAMRHAISRAVEEILGRTVRSFMSANDPARDLQVEIMLLERADDSPTHTSAAPASIAGMGDGVESASL